MPPDPIIVSLSNQFGLAARTDKDFMGQLASLISDLIENDFPRLVQILYRMDISEARLKELLLANQGGDAAAIIAKLIIEREKEKIESRNSFKQSDDIPEDEKW